MKAGVFVMMQSMGAWVAWAGILSCSLGCSRTVVILSPHADAEASVHERVLNVEAGSAETVQVSCTAPDFAQKVEVSWKSGKKVSVRYWCAVEAPAPGGLEAHVEPIPAIGTGRLPEEGARAMAEGARQ